MKSDLKSFISKRSYLFAILSIFSFFIPLANSSAEDLIKIVSSLPRTGSSNPQTTTMVNAINLAIEERGGKVGNFKIVYEDWDDASPERGTWDPAVEAANADKAIKDTDIMAMVGPFNSGAAKIAMPKTNQSQLLLLSPAASWPGLTKFGIGEPNEPKVYRPSGKINFFRVVPADDLQGAIAAKWAKELGTKKIFIVHDGELYGKGLAGIVKKQSVALGLNVAGFEQIDPKAANYKSLAVKIKQQNPEVIFFGGLTQTNGGQLAKDVVAAGVNSKFIFPDGCFEKAFIDAAGKEVLEGRSYFTFGGVPPDKLTGKGEVFFKKYLAKFKSDPEVYSAYAYEATNVILNAIEKVGKKDRAAILEEVKKTKDFDGALGVWSFDENGDTTSKTMSINSIKDGKFEFVKILD
ncbi:MAG: branched-chain amino acid ABC transporter substrate-binding protein [Proteobacteria bacterium]|nr:branched-chain amino acid ABC transporter substrate-binding protein [Pseudomonadota bacterium]